MLPSGPEGLGQVKSQSPRYDLAEVSLLARDRRVLLTRRVTTWLVNHEYDAARLTTQLLCYLPTRGRWLSTCLLANSVSADEYSVSVDQVEWYVKFYVDKRNRAVVVWSCWWQGAAH